MFPCFSIFWNISLYTLNWIRHDKIKIHFWIRIGVYICSFIPCSCLQAAVLKLFAGDTHVPKRLSALGWTLFLVRVLEKYSTVRLITDVANVFPKLVFYAARRITACLPAIPPPHPCVDVPTKKATSANLCLETVLPPTPFWKQWGSDFGPWMV